MMLVPGVITRLTTQHKALYCYCLLSVWLFILLVGMYKYIGTEELPINLSKPSGIDTALHSFSQVRPDLKTKRVLKMCSPSQSFVYNTEGYVNLNYSLESVLIILRHGDRGPLTHVRNISLINCASTEDPYLSSYKTYMENITGTPLLFQLLGPFHGLPLIPNVGCSLGQLTEIGVTQLLHTGHILRKIYLDRLGLKNATKQDGVIVYSTKYRRTLQSGLAFLYAFLSSDLFHLFVLKESESLQFCFDDCACPRLDIFAKKLKYESSFHLKSHPAILKLINDASAIIYEMYEKKIANDPYSLRDALLTYVCHGARLPCLDSEDCIRAEHLSGLFAYIDWEAKQFVKSSNLKRANLLRAYGLVKNIVSHLIRMISEKKPKFVLYSGHDKTIQYLTSALGIVSDATLSPYYASRLIFEVYHSIEEAMLADKAVEVSDYYFRVLFNGKDVTNRIHFCKGSSIKEVTSIKKTYHTIYLCSIESIIRFLHDDYFLMFNVTNLKDACILH